MKTLHRTLLLLIFAAVLFSIGLREPAVYALDYVPVSELDTQPVVAWMELFYRLVQDERVSAPAASRLYGYMGVTVYESLVPGMPDNNTLAGQIWHMPDMPLPDDAITYDWLSTFNGAFSTVSRSIFHNPSVETIEAIDEARAAMIESRSVEVGEDVVSDSVAYGDEIGKEILAWIADDNYDNVMAQADSYEIPVGEGLWELTTEGTKPAGPYWGMLRPMILEFAEECHIYPNIEYSTDEDSTFYLQAQEVVDTERNLTEEQAEIARFWVDTPGVTGTPAGHWVSIANQLVTQLELPLDRAAEMYAMLGIVLYDSFVSAWDLKYEVNLLRPVTYIQANIRRSWAPYIESPPFPEYPSGHSVTSGAAYTVLTGLFGGVAFQDDTHIIYDHEPLRRSFLSFEHAAREAAISRLYGGIHYRSAIENGVKQGECVGEYANRNIRLNPVLQGE